MRTCYTLLFALLIGLAGKGQIQWTPKPYPQDKLTPKQLWVNQQQQSKVQIAATTSCVDTSMYPQSKLSTTPQVQIMTGGFIEGIFQTYYNADTIMLHGFSLPCYLDQDFILNNTPPVKVIASVYTLNKNYTNGANYTGTLIDSVHYIITDNNNGTERIYFNSPVSITDSFVIVMDMDSIHIANGDSVYYLSNNAGNNDGGQEKLSGTNYLGIAYNNYQDIGFWDIDVYMNPIVSHTVRSNYAMSSSAVCPGDTITFTNNSSVNMGRMFNTFGPPALYQWDFGPEGTSTATSPAIQFNTSGTHSVKLVTSLYGSTLNCLDSTLMTVFVSDSADADFGFTLFGGIVQFHDSSSGATTYTWNFGDGSPVSNMQNPQHAYTSNGSFEVCLIVSDSLACTSDTICDSLTITQASVAEYGTDPASIFPNPVEDILSIKVGDGKQVGNINVYDVSGKVVYGNFHFGSTAVLSMAELSNGVYILERSDGNKRYRSKLFKQ